MKKRPKAKARRFHCLMAGEYGATLCGQGATLQAAYEDVCDGADNSGAGVAHVDNCSFWEVHPVTVETDTHTTILEVKK